MNSAQRTHCRTCGHSITEPTQWCEECEAGCHIFYVKSLCSELFEFKNFDVEQPRWEYALAQHIAECIEVYSWKAIRFCWEEDGKRIPKHNEILCFIVQPPDISVMLSNNYLARTVDDHNCRMIRITAIIQYAFEEFENDEIAFLDFYYRPATQHFIHHSYCRSGEVYGIILPDENNVVSSIEELCASYHLAPEIVQLVVAKWNSQSIYTHRYRAIEREN